MYVKIKLEDHGNSKTPIMFNIEDTATVQSLKSNLATYVNIPSEVQEIRTLDRTLENFDELGNIFNGTAISLYSDNKFFCFLQLYNKNEADQQINLFNQPPNARKLPIEQVPQYTECVDCESSAIDTDSTENSSSESDSSQDPCSVKRKKNQNSSSSAKKRHCSAVIETNDISDPPPITPSEPGDVLSKIATATESSRTTINKVAQISNIPLGEVTKQNFKIVEGEETLSRKPEQRRYTLVISNDIDETPLDYGRLMETFFDLFESFKKCSRLSFCDQSATVVYENKVWILCEDIETCDWITKSVSTLNLYKCVNFINYFDLSKCRVVLPQVVEGKELASIFQLLEMQNLGLCTKKWCVVERSIIDANSENYSAKAVTNLCKNEELVLYVDQDSKCFILNKSSKIKYCFWKLTFEL